MTFDPESLSREKLETFRNAAEAAWGDDTRHIKFSGHPNRSYGQCYVTSKWLTSHWGGFVALHHGHYVWLSPDKNHIVDLTGDRVPRVVYTRATDPSYADLRVKTDAPDTPRAKLFSKRANDILAGRKTADLTGDGVPMSEPQAVEDMNQKYLHDEPWVYDNDNINTESPSKPYKYIWVNGQLHISPVHDLEQLSSIARVSSNYTGPFAAGSVVVTDGRARWSTATNIALRGLAGILERYGHSVGWEWDGLGEDSVLSELGPHRRYWYSADVDGSLLLAEKPLNRFAGVIDTRGDLAFVRHGSRDTSLDSLESGLHEWAHDFGYKLAEYPGTWDDFGDKIKNEEGLETYDRWNPKRDWEPKEDGDPETNFTCPKCGIPLGSFGEYSLHVQDHNPITEEPIQDGHFPTPGDLDDPLPARRDNAKPVAMPLSSYKEIEHVEGFDLYSQLWGFNTDKGLRFYGAYDRGELLGYGVARPDGDKTEIVMVNAVPGRGLGQALNHIICTFHPNVYSHAGSPEGQRCLERSGFVNVKGQKYVYAAGNEPKDMIEAEVPFVYDVQRDKIQIGHPGTRTQDVQGNFTPGGIVEGYYAPGGKITFTSLTDMPYSVHHMVQLWYWTHPQMEVTSVELTDKQGNTQKVASQSVGQYIRTLASTDPAAWRAYTALKAAGGHVYVVGGAVRDALLQKEPKDIDLMVSGIPPEEVEHALSQASGSVNLTGKKFGVYRYQTHGSEVEIALPRQDKYESGRRGEGQITVDHTLPVEKDLERRDFTANSMAVSLDDGKLVDPFGGAKDIESRKLRTTHPSAFEEDPSRLLRALVASSRHGLVPDERTRQEMIQNASKLSGESPDLLNKELDKLFKSSNPAGALRMAQDTGILHHVFPEIAHNFDFDQNNPHHDFSLGDHTLNVLDHVSRTSQDPDLRLAAFLHDIAKPASAWADPRTGFNHYYQGPNGEGADHALLGSQMAETRLRDLHYPVARIRRIQGIIGNHMFPTFNAPKGARKFLQRAGDHADDLLTLREADQGGKQPNNPGDGDIDQMRGLVEQARSQQNPTQQSALSINGNDLLNIGIPAGPAVGRTLRQLTDAVVDDPTLNDRDTLHQLAQEYYNAQPSS